MFPGNVGDTAIVQAGLPGLLEQMAAAQINTPRRVAGFLATLAHESGFEYSIKQHGATGTYVGRGYVQLTGQSNYSDAGKYLGVDLVTAPELALSLGLSAKIARWYWTVARPSCNTYADTLRMGRINAAIGYPVGNGKEDADRCASFASALKYLTGAVPAGISCAR